MTTTTATYPGPRDLAKYLVGKRKARGLLAREGGRRCCIGHYCDMAGLTYNPAGLRIYPDDNSDRGNVPVLPRGHWIFDIQNDLMNANDRTAGFDAVIEMLNRKADELEET